MPEQWWTLFDDPVLNDLQHRLVIGNENLKAAIAQVAGARAALEASRSALFPTLSVGVSGTRSASPDGNVTNGSINRGPTNSVQASPNASLGARPLGTAAPGERGRERLAAGERRRPRRGAAQRAGHAGADLLLAADRRSTRKRSTTAAKAYQRLDLTQARYQAASPRAATCCRRRRNCARRRRSLLETRSTSNT